VALFLCYGVFMNDIDRSINRECFNMNYDKVRDELLKLFTIDYRAVDPLEDDELVLHIRSGDIVCDFLHDDYIIPPLSYYTKFIDSNNFKKIYILAEDTQNLCIESLKNKYSNVEFELRSLTDDIELVLRAKNVMMSIGSFIPELIWVTKNVKEVIYPNYDEFAFRFRPLENMVPNVKLTSIDLTEYYNEVKSANDTIQTRMLRALTR
jgi:hypothetical protein